MTLEEARKADLYLSFFDKNHPHGLEVPVKFFDTQNQNYEAKYTALLLSKGHLKYNKENYRYYLTNNGQALRLFYGGYTKMIENEIKEERLKKRKEIFDISKDVLLILLSLLSLYLGTS